MLNLLHSYYNCIKNALFSIFFAKNVTIYNFFWYNLITGGYNIYVDIISTTGLITLV